MVLHVFWCCLYQTVDLALCHIFIYLFSRLMMASFTCTDLRSNRWLMPTRSRPFASFICLEVTREWDHIWPINSYFQSKYFWVYENGGTITKTAAFPLKNLFNYIFIVFWVFSNSLCWCKERKKIIKTPKNVQTLLDCTINKLCLALIHNVLSIKVTNFMVWCQLKLDF